MLAATGFWPSEIPFESRDLATVIKIINDQRKEARNGRKV